MKLGDSAANAFVAIIWSVFKMTLNKGHKTQAFNSAILCDNVLQPSVTEPAKASAENRHNPKMTKQIIDKNVLLMLFVIFYVLNKWVTQYFKSKY